MTILYILNWIVFGVSVWKDWYQNIYFMSVKILIQVYFSDNQFQTK